MKRSSFLVIVALAIGFAAGFGLRSRGGGHGTQQAPSSGAHAGHEMADSTEQIGHAGHEMSGGGEHAGHGAAAAPPAERKVLYWVDPMHPAYKSDKPGKAPDCGMDLVPVYADEQTDEAPGTVRLTTERRQMIGVKTGEVTRQPLTKVIRAVSTIGYDETKVREVRTKFSGWVKHLFVDFDGKQVDQGAPLFTVYSPDLVSTQVEYLLALEGKTALQNSTFPEAASGSVSLLDVSKKRLLLWDIAPREIRELEETKTPKTFLTLYSPIKGFVVQRNVFEGRYITPEMELFKIADLSTVWLNADIYEYELPLVKVGQEATVSLSYYPNERFRGRVVYIYPYLNGETRTARVRFEFPNPDWKLKPQMYANVELQIDLGEQLVVPQEAVLDSGAHKTAFVAHDDGRFEPRELQLGPAVDASVAVLSGLREGEKVVVSGNYLIDSESRLKSALSGMGGMPGMPGMSGMNATPSMAGTPTVSGTPGMSEMPGMPDGGLQAGGGEHQH